MLHVVVVEDDDATRQSIVELLEGEGYSVTAAADGAEGLRALRERRVDVVVLDLAPPGMDGREFRRRQLADPRIADVPVVVVSGAAPPRLEGAPLVAKPLDPDLLVAALALATRGRRR